ncbi:zinc finger, CCHC-type containing protein [Tanacetum coccineum]
MGDKNPIRTLGDYSKPSHKGYRNTIELPKGNNVVPLRSDTILLVQNTKTDALSTDFGSISTWEDLTTRFLAQFFLPGRTTKLRNDILMFQQYQGESLSEALDYAAEGRLRKMSAEKAWNTIEELARYENEGWNDPVFPEEECLDYKKPNIEELLGIMKCKVDILMKNEAFEDLVMNFILDQEEKVKQLEEYMNVIGSDFMHLSLESRYDVENPNPQVLLSFEKNTPPVTYPDEVEEIIGIPIEVEPLDETPLEDLGLNTCNHDIPLSSREIPSFDELEL